MRTNWLAFAVHVFRPNQTITMRTFHPIRYVNTNKLSILGLDGSKSFSSIWRVYTLTLRIPCLKNTHLRNCELGTEDGCIVTGPVSGERNGLKERRQLVLHCNQNLEHRHWQFCATRMKHHSPKRRHLQYYVIQKRLQSHKLYPSKAVLMMTPPTTKMSPHLKQK